MSEPPRVGTTDAVLAVLRERYRSAIGATLASLDRLGGQLADTPTEQAVLESVRREVHRIHGSAGSYGFAAVSRLARVFEQRLSRWSDDAGADAGERATMVLRFTAAIRREVLDGDGADADGSRSVLLVDLKGAHVDAIEAEAILRGYRTRRVTLATFTPALAAQLQPRAVLVAAKSAAGIPRSLAAPVLVVAPPRGDAGQHITDVGAVGSLVISEDESPSSVIDVIDGLASIADHRGATIIIVDDDPVILSVLRAIAEHDGLRVIALPSAEFLMPVLLRERPVMLLMDVLMGATDGVAVTRALRASPMFRDLPVVLFSSEQSSAMRNAAFAAGADDFFGKPLAPKEVHQRIRERLEQRRWKRVADGWHPVVHVALPARTADDGPAAWSTVGEGTLLMLHPGGGAAPGAWISEVARVTALAGNAIKFAGFLDGEVLVCVTAKDVPWCAEFLRGARSSLPDGAPPWHAGIVPRVRTTQAWEDALLCGREAVDVARRAVHEPVHEWTAADTAIPPDVILVEDDASLADMLQYALQLAGFTYRHFSDGRVALETLLAMKLGSHRPVLFLDVDLPGLDGHTIHDRLRVERPGAFVCVFVTAHGSEAEQLRALNAGAWDYLTKPISLRVLLAKLPVWLSRAAEVR
jgi:DNA-binding response OmpR family regulator/HPt (histidine-containing phosphotransfer) domain-containing protein